MMQALLEARLLLPSNLVLSLGIQQPLEPTLASRTRYCVCGADQVLRLRWYKYMCLALRVDETTPCIGLQWVLPRTRLSSGSWTICLDPGLENEDYISACQTKGVSGCSGPNPVGAPHPSPIGMITLPTTFIARSCIAP